MRGHIFIIDRILSFFFHASPFINSKTPTSAASPLKSKFLSAANSYQQNPHLCGFAAEKQIPISYQPSTGFSRTEHR